MRPIPGVCDSDSSKKRGRDSSTRLHIVFEETLEKVCSSRGHFECKTKNQKMDTGAASPSIASAFPNFRRFTRGYNPNASDTMKEDQVIDWSFKVIVEGFERGLKLPERFCNLSGEIPDEAILISCKGMWAVEFARGSSHGLLTLSGNGWRSFMDHHDLQIDDFIWFEQTDRMVFRTHICDLSACEKDFSPSLDNLRSAESNGQAERRGICFCQHLQPKFCRKGKLNAGCFYHQDQNQFIAPIEAHHLKHNYLTIPSEFLKWNDLTEKKTAILVNSGGHAWEVELACYLDQRLQNSFHRNMKLRNGWSAFFKANKLRMGDVCVFEVDPWNNLSSSTNIVLKVKIVRVT